MIEIILFFCLAIFILSSLICCKYKGYGYIPIFFSCYFIFILIIPAFFHVEKNIYPFYGLSYSFEDQFNASIILLFFSIFFWLGFFLKRPSRRKKNDINDIVKIDRTRFFLIYFLIFLLLAFYIFSHGIDSFLVRRSEFDRGDFGSNSVIADIILSSFKSLSFGAVFYLIALKSKINKMIWVVCFLLSLSFFLIINYPLALSRFMFFSYIIVILCFYIPPSFKSKLLIFTIFGLGITTIFPYFSYITRGDTDDKFSINMLEYYQSSGDFDGFQSIVNSVLYVDKYGYTFGTQIVSSIFSFIPRSIWTSKAEPTGLITASAAGYDFTNISSPLPAEFYIDFGILGVIFFSFTFGCFLRSFDGKRLNDNKINLRYIISILLISLIPIISRGSLLAILNSVYAEIFIFCLLYCIFFKKIRLK